VADAEPQRRPYGHPRSGKKALVWGKSLGGKGLAGAYPSLLGWPGIIGDSEEVIAEYLNVALSSEDPDLFLQAIADVAKARGMARVAKETGLGRENLYKALAPGAKPRYDTVLKLICALGVELHMTPVVQKA